MLREGMSRRVMIVFLLRALPFLDGNPSTEQSAFRSNLPVNLVPDRVIRTLRMTLLSDSG